MDLMRDQSLKEFLTSLQRFTDHRGRLERSSTLVAASGWFKRILLEKKIYDFLTKHYITWQFNLSRALNRAPRLGGQFERITGLTKQALSKTIGKTKLT